MQAKVTAEIPPKERAAENLGFILTCKLQSLLLKHESKKRARVEERERERKGEPKKLRWIADISNEIPPCYAPAIQT